MLSGRIALQRVLNTVYKRQSDLSTCTQLARFDALNFAEQKKIFHTCCYLSCVTVSDNKQHRSRTKHIPTHKKTHWGKDQTKNRHDFRHSERISAKETISLDENDTERRVGLNRRMQRQLLTRRVAQPADARVAKVAIIGAPNAGKSTLLNQLIKWKVAPVSSKVHTTRHKTVGVLTEDNRQVVFLDTPGMITPERRKKHFLEYSLLTDPHSCLFEADIILVVVDAINVWERTQLPPEILKVLNLHRNKKCALVLNKCDVSRNKRELLHSTRMLTEGVIGAKRDWYEVISKPKRKERFYQELFDLVDSKRLETEQAKRAREAKRAAKNVDTESVQSENDAKSGTFETQSVNTKRAAKNVDIESVQGENDAKSDTFETQSVNAERAAKNVDTSSVQGENYAKSETFETQSVNMESLQRDFETTSDAVEMQSLDAATLNEGNVTESETFEKQNVDSVSLSQEIEAKSGRIEKQIRDTTSLSQDYEERSKAFETQNIQSTPFDNGQQEIYDRKHVDNFYEIEHVDSGNTDDNMTKASTSDVTENFHNEDKFECDNYETHSENMYEDSEIDIKTENTNLNYDFHKYIKTEKGEVTPGDEINIGDTGYKLEFSNNGLNNHENDGFENADSFVYAEFENPSDDKTVAMNCDRNHSNRNENSDYVNNANVDNDKNEAEDTDVKNKDSNTESSQHNFDPSRYRWEPVNRRKEKERTDFTFRTGSESGPQANEESARSARLWQGYYYGQLKRIWQTVEGKKGFDGFDRAFAVSALTGLGVEDLKEYLFESTKPGAWVYHKSVVTDTDPVELAEMCVKEVLLDHLQKRAPYTTHVKSVYWTYESDVLKAQFDVQVPHERAKKYLLSGHPKNIAVVAGQVRHQLMDVFHTEVYLRLGVSIKQKEEDKRWRKEKKPRPYLKWRK